MGIMVFGDNEARHECILFNVGITMLWTNDSDSWEMA